VETTCLWSSDLLARIETGNFLKNIITGDETWVYSYDPETKQPFSQGKFPTLLWPDEECQLSPALASVFS
jgi:hypothetical protein